MEPPNVYLSQKKYTSPSAFQPELWPCRKTLLASSINKYEASALLSQAQWRLPLLSLAPQLFLRIFHLMKFLCLPFPAHQTQGSSLNQFNKMLGRIKCDCFFLSFFLSPFSRQLPALFSAVSFTEAQIRAWKCISCGCQEMWIMKIETIPSPWSQFAHFFIKREPLNKTLTSEHLQNWEWDLGFDCNSAIAYDSSGSSQASKVSH